MASDHFKTGDTWLNSAAFKRGGVKHDLLVTSPPPSFTGYFVRLSTGGLQRLADAHSLVGHVPSLYQAFPTDVCAAGTQARTRNSRKYDQLSKEENKTQ